MKIKVNDKDVAYPADRMTYTALCELAGVAEDLKPSATYRLPNGASGVLWSGNTAPVVEGGRYNIYHTGHA